MLNAATSTPGHASFDSAAHGERKINLETVILNDSMLLVTSVGTAWVNVFNLDINIARLPVLYKEVVALARTKGAKINYKRGTKKIITSIMDGAMSELAAYRQIYGLLKSSWEVKVVKGLFTPVLDDQELDNMSDMACRLTRMLYRPTALGQARTLEEDLLDLKSRLEGVSEVNQGFSISL